MRPLVHPAIEEVPVEAILHALSDPVRVAIYADIVKGCSENCPTFLTVATERFQNPRSPFTSGSCAKPDSSAASARVWRCSPPYDARKWTAAIPALLLPSSKGTKSRPERTSGYVANGDMSLLGNDRVECRQRPLLSTRVQALRPTRTNVVRSCCNSEA